MKTKLYRLVILLCCIVASILALSACGQKHEHVFSNCSGVVDDENHSVKCECGESQIEAHVFKDNECLTCGFVKGTDGLVYTSKSKDGQSYYSLSGYTGDNKSVVISSHVNGVPVAEIEREVFLNKDISSVKIPDTIATIGARAFDGCNYLTYLSLGKGVKAIGERCFFNCQNLSSVHFNGTIADWCGIAFENASSTPAVQTGNVFINEEIIKELVIPEGTREIKNYAFYGFTQLEKVVCNSELESIGDYAFYNDYSMRELSFNNNLTSIGNSAFEFCQKLTSVVIPDKVQTIGSRAFFYCGNLYEVVIGAAVKSLSDDAFGSCGKLIEVFNKSSLEIGEYKNVYTPSEGTKKISYQGDYIFYTDADQVYLVGSSKFESVLTLPDDHNGQNYIIYKSAFSGRNELQEVYIGSGVTEIQDEAFAYCDFMTKVHIGKNVTKVGEHAFRRLKHIYFAGSVEEWCSIQFHYPFGFSAYALYFENEKAENLIIPEGVTKLNDEVFNKCTSLVTITLPESLTRIEYGALWDCMSLQDIYFSGTIEQWQAVYVHPNAMGNTPVHTVHCKDGDASI